MIKIRLQSIDGKVGDPIYNEAKMEEAVNQAIKDNIDLIVFPKNSIIGVSLDDLLQNECYKSMAELAEDRFEAFIQRQAIEIRYKGESEFDLSDLHFGVFDEPIECSVEFLANIEKDMKTLSRRNSNVYLLCQGRGTESVCRSIYSNLKMIIYKGKTLASNRNLDSDILDFDFDEDAVFSRYPYLDLIDDKDAMYEDILHMQEVGLYNKMKSMNRFKICLGVSGGLDSTVSLLVCVAAFKKYQIPLTNIIAVTMPGLGTTERTYNNAMSLMKSLGVTIEDIDLKPLLRTHLKNISQPEGKYDVTFEQTQSRERTQVLLDIANRDNAIMIGTGCMSEFALGWMTYGGDHLCMYAINIGLPKTVVKGYAQWFIDNLEEENNPLSKTVEDILHGPVSPELMPVDENGQQHEKTEGIIGDYKVQDFFIYQMTVENCSIERIFRRTCIAFPEYDPKQILAWLEIFTLRYFTRAYKKNCYGDGVKIFNFSVSPNDYHVPSDIVNTIWKKEIEDLKNEINK